MPSGSKSYRSVIALAGTGLKFTTTFVVPDASPTVEVATAKLAVALGVSLSLIVRVCAAFVVPTV